MSAKDIDPSEEKEIKNAMLEISAAMMLTTYIKENVVFGNLKRGQKVPIASYLYELDLDSAVSLINSENAESDIMQNGIVCYDLIGKLYYELYGDKVSDIFADAPIEKKFDFEDPVFRFKNGLYEYLKDTYELFKEIIVIEVEADVYDRISALTKSDKLHFYYSKIGKFIKAIKMKKLRQGSCVDRYLKDLDYISPFVMRLVKKQKGRYILRNSDPDSLDYKLALFSCFRFCNEENAKLLELKINAWEEFKYTSNYLLSHTGTPV